MMVRYFGRSWYISIFIAVMGYAAGAALEGDYSYVSEALSAAGDMDGARLMGLAFQSLLMDMGLYLWSSMLKEPSRARALALPAVWLKMMVVGLCCRGLLYGGITFRGLALCLVNILGGSAVCASLLLNSQERAGTAYREARRMRLYLWTAGALTEGILIPSLARTFALLFK